ncbi:Cof-type HAD-IIB family hydrolase [Neisseria wadsworthii]|uniref:IIB family HAD hydrolase n=1 Tax=Neisseria wadsworthii 9715 TaxID=1030841 RepID=G4CP59_9NEIS|nr:Cof-type HAD-IIB family hydrolase [Neisseria wadsworthii]EGZ48573.1 IIB family HAD hydrolase [Neisseria wadsworthii 9715]QMT34695.1 Cof-type HAD-IIB family hydrolase [Neisseria wadsworthii]
MHTPNPKIIFFDIDDTLYSTKEHRIAESTRAALKALNRKGFITAIATGRAPCLLPEVIRELIEETGIDMLVSINGQYVRHKGKTLAEFPLPQASVQEIITFLKQADVAYGLVSVEHFSVSRETEALLDAAGALKLPYRIAPDAYLHDPVYQIIGFYDEATEQSLNGNLPAGIKTVRWHPYGVDLLDEGGSKARGIQVALDKLGLTMADAMAFGDGPNDIEMMKAVGFGVVMGNGHPDTKAVADFVCPPVTEDGVYRGLLSLGLIEEMPV